VQHAAVKKGLIIPGYADVSPHQATVLRIRAARSSTPGLKHIDPISLAK